MKVIFTGIDGLPHTLEGRPGQRLLDLAQDDGQPLEGTCGGDLACATCHVVIDPADFDRLPPPSEEEEDMLDFADDTTRTSRLACQIVLADVLDGMKVSLPGGSR